MSAITRAYQHAQMIKDIEALKSQLGIIQRVKVSAAEEYGFGNLLPGLQALDAKVGEIERRLIALETKRGPGRPPKSNG